MTWQGTSFVWAPAVALVGIGLLVLVLWWSARPGSSVVPRPARRGPPDDYGALVAVATPATAADAEAAVARLMREGIRATKAQTMAGHRVYVWPRDEERATAVLRPR